MRLVVTGGGTGGHVFPALTIIEALQELLGGGAEGALTGAGLQPLYLGTANGVEQALVTEAGLPFWCIPAGPLRGQGIRSTLRGLLRLVQGTRLAYREIRRFQPHAALATGGYVSAPVALAARLAGVPLIQYLPDVRPGWTIAALSWLAHTTAVTAEASRRYLRGRRIVVTGYPVRPAIRQAQKADGLRHFGFTPQLPVLLVMGGSRGASAINAAIAAGLESLLAICQLIHVTGQAEATLFTDRQQALPDALRPRYAPRGFLTTELPLAMAAADLAITRAGASTMGELPAAGLPAILVPYPYAGAHQRLNAAVLAEAGAARVLDNADLDQLVSQVTYLLATPEGQQARQHMAEAMRQLDRPQAAHDIARLVLDAARATSPSASAQGAVARGRLAV